MEGIFGNLSIGFVEVFKLQAITIGGVSMTLADNAMGVSAWHAAGETPTATIDFGMKFIAAGKGGGPLYGRLWIERRTRDLCFSNAELWNHGRKIATASGVWKYIDPKTGWGRDGA